MTSLQFPRFSFIVEVGIPDENRKSSRLRWEHEMKERRKLERKHLMFYSRIFDRKTGKFVGYLGDITKEGAMIISEDEVGTGQDFMFRMDLPELIYPQPMINLDMRSVWCQRDVDPNFYNTGFLLLNVTQQDIVIIERIIEDYGFLGDRNYTPG
jgi:hypothetical protein